MGISICLLFTEFLLNWKEDNRWIRSSKLEGKASHCHLLLSLFVLRYATDKHIHFHSFDMEITAIENDEFQTAF